MAMAERRVMVIPFTINSDVKVDSIPEGTCYVKGKVFDEYRKPLFNGLVSTTDFKKQTRTDSSGCFILELSDSDSSIFFFQMGYRETVVQYDFKSQHLVEIDFFGQSSKQSIHVRKPVVYCYSDKPITVNLNYDFKSDLVFSYPEYNDGGWDIELDKEGVMYEGQNYPYLFWEGQTDHLNYEFQENSVEGYFIKTDTLISFLENTLIAYGLNQNERADFITFWGPEMIGSPYAFVQFREGDWYDTEIASLKVSHKPESMLRLFMMYSPLEFESLGELDIQEPTIPPFKRGAFTIIEWGGADLPANKLIKNIIN